MKEAAAGKGFRNSQSWFTSSCLRCGFFGFVISAIVILIYPPRVSRPPSGSVNGEPIWLPASCWFFLGQLLSQVPSRLALCVLRSALRGDMAVCPGRSSSRMMLLAFIGRLSGRNEENSDAVICSSATPGTPRSSKFPAPSPLSSVPSFSSTFFFGHDLLELACEPTDGRARPPPHELFSSAFPISSVISPLTPSRACKVSRNVAGAPAQKLFVQLGYFAGNHHMPRVLSQNLDKVRQRLDDPVRSFVENLRPRRSLDRFQRARGARRALPEENR